MSKLFLNNNQRVFGTFPLTGNTAIQAITDAIQVGYRAFDTAQMYGNEADVGTALSQSGLPRNEFCVITKVHPDNYTNQDTFLTSVEESVNRLKLDTIDVLFLHWPPSNGQIDQPLEFLQAARERGLTQEIGISNFNAKMMRRARDIVDGPIAANQIEFHPLLNQQTLLNTSAETGIALFAYSSIARGEVFKYALFNELATKYSKHPGQIVLRWILQKGVIANTMSTKLENIRQNFDVMDFIISTPDMARIDELSKINYRVVTSAKVPWAPEWD
jgi:2,5-diketo-D-gluconate reductase B